MKYDRLKLANNCYRQREGCKLFIVRNTGEKDLHVIACDAACARWVALQMYHIRSLENGTVLIVGDDWLAKDEPFISALRRAVAGGFPGAIKRVEDNAVIIENLHAGIEGKVYPPLSSVSP
jgi:hypothetical protein